MLTIKQCYLHQPLLYQKKVVSVKAGLCTTGAPLSTVIGVYGLNIKQIVETINNLSVKYQGSKINIVIYIDVKLKKYELEIEKIRTSTLLKTLGSKVTSYDLEKLKQQYNLKTPLKTLIGTLKTLKDKTRTISYD